MAPMTTWCGVQWRRFTSRAIFFAGQIVALFWKVSGCGSGCRVPFVAPGAYRDGGYGQEAGTVRDCNERVRRGCAFYRGGQQVLEGKPAHKAKIRWEDRTRSIREGRSSHRQVGRIRPSSQPPSCGGSDDGAGDDACGDDGDDGDASSPEPHRRWSRRGSAS
ncbi:MAG: hypothetical protein E5V65_09155 [Mesorhizobium sp.]|nr:MAG: hypothetical protein E5V65_09155 [Mesorhizobium sp.]